MKRTRTLETILLSACVLWAIGCGERASEDGSAAGGAAVQGDTAATGGAPSAGGPASADQAMVALGSTLFKSKGCNACHTLGGGRLVGPDLAGVTERRQQEWIVGMIVKPDSMLANDETARQLLAEYFTPMPNQGLTRDEAHALYQYFRHNDADGGS